MLCAEVAALLAPAPGKRFLDCTLGAGGHSAPLLAAGACVLGIDRDPRARALASERLHAHSERLTIRGGTFSEAAAALVAAGERFDGVLADLGMSSMQLDEPGRGFSLHDEHPLDMRMGDGCVRDALAVIDGSDEAALVQLLRTYGEERQARRVARALKRARAHGIASAAGLAAAIRAAIPGRHRRHPALRAFQALRIAVNDELGELERLLGALPALLAAGGCAVIIAFHSLEDRLVKRAFREQLARGLWREIARTPLRPTPAEIAANSRAHSAKLRWARRAP
ncbi:MAG: 16S rRNA (cytosine(1402)-N(4))-methyltransferase RsmH [Planctomycetota bacterium]|nr:16S rRNA (cytosine(1402)-N(4))-methyltransferase RsmH [Planctomycetota bacterium]